MLCCVEWWNAKPSFATLPEKVTENIKIFTQYSGKGTQNRPVYNQTLVNLRHYATTAFLSFYLLNKILISCCLEASRGAGAQSVTVKSTGSGVRSPLEEVKYLFKFIFPFLRSSVEQSAALNSSIQLKIPPELVRKSGTECLNTRLPLPTLLCAGYSVKLI